MTNRQRVGNSDGFARVGTRADEGARAATAQTVPLISARRFRQTSIDVSDIRRAFRAGRVVRVRRGVYVHRDDWDRLDGRGQHLVRMRAVDETTRDAVFGFESAAAAFDLPLLERWPEEVHLLAPRATGGRSDPGIRRHCVGISATHVVERSGLRVSSLARTLLDIARSRSFELGVAMIDSALNSGRLTDSDLEAEGKLRGAGAAKARRVLDFCDARAESPGESLSRVRIHQLGFPPPELQRRFIVDVGTTYTVDFFWPELRLIGEFDGRGKYVREEFRRGRSSGDVVVAEKRREDRLRAELLNFTRWGWAELRSPARLRALLLRAGLEPGNRICPMSFLT